MAKDVVNQRDAERYGDTSSGVLEFEIRHERHTNSIRLDVYQWRILPRHMCCNITLPQDSQIAKNHHKYLKQTAKFLRQMAIDYTEMRCEEVCHVSYVGFGEKHVKGIDKLPLLGYNPKPTEIVSLTG